ncbi:MAG: phage holin family protein, partial [Bacteroidota bacterium]
AIVLSILNFFLITILVLLTLPITILTLGLFLLVVNAIILEWVSPKSSKSIALLLQV